MTTIPRAVRIGLLTAAILVPSGLLADSYQTGTTQVTSVSDSNGPGTTTTSTTIKVTTPNGTTGEVRTTENGMTTVTPLSIPAVDSLMPSMSMPMDPSPAMIAPGITDLSSLNQAPTYAPADPSSSQQMPMNNMQTYSAQNEATVFTAPPIPPLDPNHVDAFVEGLQNHVMAIVNQNMEQSRHEVDVIQEQLRNGQPASNPGMTQQYFSISLSATEETPSVQSNASGVGQFTLRDHELRYHVQSMNLTSNATAAHFHQGMPGVKGPVVQPISISADGTADGVWMLNDDQLAALKRGEIYVNVHTANYPDGEIRGQLQL